MISSEVIFNLNCQSLWRLGLWIRSTSQAKQGWVKEKEKEGEPSDGVETQRTATKGDLSKVEEGISSRDQVQRRKGEVAQQK